VGCRSSPLKLGAADPGIAGEGRSSSDNGGTGRHCQTVRVRQARREGVRVQKPVVEPPQVKNRLQSGGYGSDSSARPNVSSGDSVACVCQVKEATRKACGVLVARLQGISWAPHPSTGQW
jgi:hypothetical protein